MAVVCLTFEEIAELFLKGCTILHSHLQYIRVSVTLYPYQYFVVSLISDILIGMRWYWNVLICISLMFNDIEQLFMYLLVTYISSLVRYLFRFFAKFLIRLFVFFLMGFVTFLIYSGNSLSNMWFPDQTFSPTQWLGFSFS